MHPEISIIITNYNYSKYLGKCIESCINQDADINYEVIIVDDGSTDASLDVAEPYLCDKVHLIKIDNSGIEVASNIGIRSAKGELIIRVDADDYLIPEYLGAVVKNMKVTSCSF